jgi:lysozyme C
MTILPNLILTLLFSPSGLVDDCLTDDIACAKLIYAAQGFAAWWGWQDNCQGQSLPEITPC